MYDYRLAARGGNGFDKFAEKLSEQYSQIVTEKLAERRRWRERTVSSRKITVRKTRQETVQFFAKYRKLSEERRLPRLARYGSV